MQACWAAIAFTFSLESEVLGQMSAFVVASDHQKVVGKHNFVAIQQQHTFNSKEAAIDVIPKEKIC